jgi:hypothetical protein
LFLEHAPDEPTRLSGEPPICCARRNPEKLFGLLQLAGIPGINPLLERLLLGRRAQDGSSVSPPRRDPQRGIIGGGGPDQAPERRERRALAA